MPTRLAFAVALLTLNASPGFAVGQNDPVLQVGVGTHSCASWLNGPMLRRDGEQWILGFWTAMNAFSEPGGVVGHTTDQAGIVGEVWKACETQPSLALMFATYRAYIRMQKASR